METKAKALGIVAVFSVVALLGLTGLAAASGTGYDLSFTQSASGSNANADLTAVSSNDPGGPNITVTLTVAGTFQLTSGDYFYGAWFGGSSVTNATAEAVFTNNSTVGYYAGYGSGAGGFGYLTYTLSSGGSTLTFSIAKTIVPPSTSYSLNGFALYSSDDGKTGTYSWLGSNYNGGGTCTTTACTGTGGTTSSSSFDWWIVIIPVVVIVVVIALVLVFVMRRKPPMQPAMGQPMAPPGAPMDAAGQPTWQNPPPPPPPPA